MQMWTSERDTLSYQHDTFANTLVITCYLDALQNIRSYKPVTSTVTFVLLSGHCARVLLQRAQGRSREGSNRAGSCGFSRSPWVGRSWLSGDPGHPSALSVVVTIPLVAPDHQSWSWATPWLLGIWVEMYTDNITNSSDWTLRIFMLISFPQPDPIDTSQRHLGTFY